MKNFKIFAFLSRYWQVLIFFLVILFLSLHSWGHAFDYFFWKDDWIFLWGGKYNLQVSYASLGGAQWLVKTGLFMKPYVLLYKYVENPYIWQLSGFILRLVNCILLYFFTYSFSGSKKISVVATLIFSSYSGGIDAYTWHRISGLVITFILLGFIFLNKYLDKPDTKKLFLWILFFLLSLATYVGRAIGFVPALLFWVILNSFGKKPFKKTGLIPVVFLSAFVFIFISLFKPSYIQSPSSYLLDSLKYINVFFGTVGNLLRNPFLWITEQGGLAGIDSISILLGKLLLGVVVVLGLLVICFKKEKYKLMLFFSSWIFLFYGFNWLFAGGGPSTSFGSGHRYLALSAVGVSVFTALLIGRAKGFLFLTIVIFLIVINLSYARKIDAVEYSTHGRQIVENAYRKVSVTDTDAKVIVISNSGNLKTNVVMWSQPYAYAYYKGVDSQGKFPTVIQDWAAAEEWLCAKTVEDKIKIEQRIGFVGFQREIKDTRSIYAWTLKDDGFLENKTENMWLYVEECGVGKNKP